MYNATKNSLGASETIKINNHNLSNIYSNIKNDDNVADDNEYDNDDDDNDVTASKGNDDDTDDDDDDTTSKANDGDTIEVSKGSSSAFIDRVVLQRFLLIH